ncbi:PAS domain-containing protein [Pseudenhygromyxa sp. WMMC2535]|uniref:PAS domain-containing protein n=1 Tax=Pseudenhygromyxa sp. WMMC2535 TaxID=2712867 RepID=UPI00155486D9|nr:PAS domain-containing protein [Pseudenhygromyxa sp. WMMC2535]NVB36688.1 PAS domain-containing protein [Pseudenhygromyxa sp. WMMC2535]
MSQQPLAALLDEPAFALAVLDAAPVIVLVLDDAGRVVHYNAFMETLCGRPLDDARGHSWFDEFILDDDREWIGDLFSRSIRGQEAHANINPIHVVGGPPRLIEWYDRTVELREGGEVYLVAIGVDISDRVREANERAALAERFELFAKRVDAAFFIADEAHARMLYISPAFERITGLARDAACADIQALIARLHPDDREHFSATFASPLAPGVQVEHDYRLLRPDPDGGEPELRWLSLRYSCVDAPRKHGLRIAGTLTDITARKQATLEREQLGRLFTLIDTAIDEVFLLIDERRERVLYASESVERVFGVEREALYGALPWTKLSVIHPADRQRVRAALTRPAPAHGGAQAPSPQAIEFRVCLPEGRERWVLCRSHILDERSAMPGAMVTISSDITAQHAAEERLLELMEELEARVAERTASLAEERERLRRVLDGMTAFVAILDPEGALLELNNLARERFEVRDQGARRRAFELIVGLDPNASCRSCAGRALRQAQAGRPARFDLELTTPDGQPRVIDVGLGPICGEHGQVTEIVATGVDVTEARDNEQRLRASLAALAIKEARLADAQRLAEVGDWDWDICADKLSWSDQIFRIFGLEVGSTTPKYDGFMAMVHEEDRPLVAAALQRSFEHGEPYTIEHRLVRPDGEVRYLFEQGELTRDADGRPLRLQGTTLDITRQKRVEAQLRASLAEKDALLNEVHHRVKNNLQVVVSLLYLQGLGLDEAMRAVLDECRGRIRSMVLIHEQLYLSGQLSSIDMREFLLRLSSELERVFATTTAASIDVRGAGLHLDIQRAVPLALIANELLTNALKYAYPRAERAAAPTPDSQQIRVEISEAGLLVEDDGVGLPEGFDQNEGSTLGLRLIRTLTEQLDASLRVDEGPKGRGARFHLRLPADDR